MLTYGSIKRVSFILLIFIATVSSFKLAFFVNGTDADTVLPLTLWTGFKSGGWQWIEHFSFTPDNWLFSIIPFDFIAFYCFGPQPWLVIFSGWIVFFLAACVTGFIASSFNARRAAKCLPIILLIIGSGIQMSAAASFSVSHNISNLYGLTILLCMFRAFKTKDGYLIFLICLLLSLSALSDPWMIPAYAIPCLVVSIFGWINSRPKTDKNFFRSLTASLVLVIIFVETHGFNLFYFLPSQSTKIASIKIILHNMSVVANALFGMFDFLPFIQNNQWLSILLTVFAAICIAIIYQKSFYFHELNTGAASTLTTSIMILSMAATISGIILLDLKEDSAAPRFMINVFYLAFTLLGIFIDLNWKSFSLWKKGVFAAILFLAFIGGISDIFPTFSNPDIRLKTDNVEARIDFLKANGLTYGYGPYHGSDANAVTVLSRGSVTIRPVVFNPSNGMMTNLLRAQSSPSWYSPHDFPGGQKLFFIYLVNDGEECKNVALCIAGLTTQFGPPIKILKFQSAQIMVWNHSLLGYPYSVSGDYWSDGAWGWMGKSITIMSRQTMIIKLQGTPYGSPVTKVSITLNGKMEKFDLSAGDVKTVEIPASSTMSITAAPTFSAYKVIHAKRTRQYSLKIALPQPAP